MNAINAIHFFQFTTHKEFGVIIMHTGGFGSYILAMDETSYNLIGSSVSGNRVQDVKNPSLGWIIAFVFTVSFVGIFSLVPLRKVHEDVLIIPKPFLLHYSHAPLDCRLT